MSAPDKPRPPPGGDEAADLLAAFGACDTGGDGRIVYAEFERLLQGLGSRLDGGRRRSEFSRIDTDGNGYIDLVEFERWWSAS
jgi:Ca2+-binding EF-hand superfamily protein